MRGIVVLLVSVPAAIVGWWGLAELTRRFSPSEPGVVPFFYALLFLAITATLAPLVGYLNRRFALEAYRRDPWRVLRHSAWCGLCLSSWAWLQMQRAFNPAFAVIIAMIFVAIEALLIRLKAAA